MKVVNLDSWSGPDFYCAPNEIIDLPEATALARIAAGLATPAPEPKKSGLFKSKDTPECPA